MSSRHPIWKASCETENFEFEAYGKTRASAVDALKQAFRKHAKQVGISTEWWRDYHINVSELAFGKAYRDREEM